MPYIPAKHRKYDLLPMCRKHGGEVFNYPSDIYNLENELKLLEYGRTEGVSECIFPYGYQSYDQYYDKLDETIEFCKEADVELMQRLYQFKVNMIALNTKENWSVVRFVGDARTPLFGLTKGQCYYWSCSPDNPIYEGVIDDEEFTSYLYPCDPDSWIIEEDPTGMAAYALEGACDTISVWKLGLNDVTFEDAPYYRIVKSIIDKWNPYSLLPDAPIDEFDRYSLRIARRIRNPVRTDEIAWIMKKEMGEFLGDDNYENYLEVASSIYKVITVEEDAKVSGDEGERIFETLIFGTNEEIEEIAKTYKGRLRYGWSKHGSGSFSIDVDNVGIRSKGPIDPPNCVRLYGESHSF